MKDKDKEVFNYPRVLLVKKDGFTLNEVLISVLILGIVLAGLFITLSTGEFSSSVSSAKLEVQAETRRLMDWIVKDVRQTSSSQIANNAPSNSHIKFKVCLGHDSSNIIWSSDFIEYTYDSSLNRLTRTDYSSGTSWNFDNIIAAPFNTSELLTDSKLTVTITVQKQGARIPVITSTLISKIKIRNG
jgi:prepilin-type N-terminal cleavage/methylation domain-containing protein